jgi:hypothetical protein
MVARRSDANTTSLPPGDFLARLFEMWRRFLSRSRDALVGLRERLSPAEKPDALSRPWLLRPGIVWIGAASLALGVVLGVALSPPGPARSLAIWAGIQSALWAPLRWLVMKYASRRRALEDAALLGASSLGLVAYALAVTPELQAAAWVVSAAITWAALGHLGDDRREAAKTVGLAWGAQALVLVASWISRSGVIAFLASRG